MLAKRVGPFPLWVWLIVVTVGVYLFLRMRGGGTKPSTVNDADNLTAQQATLVPYANDIFVNVISTPNGTPASKPVPAKGRYGYVPTRLRDWPWIGNRNPGPLPPGTGTPVPRVTSVTYQVPPGGEPGTQVGLARLFGFTGSAKGYQSTPLVVPT